MDRLQWTLELIDKLSGPGKSAAAAFERMTDSQVEALSAARRLADVEEKSARALKEVQDGTRKLTAEDLDLVDATRKARREFEAADSAMGELHGTAGRGMTGSLLEAAIWENLARGILGAARALVEYGARAAIAVGMKFFDAAQWAQDTRSSLAVFAGSVAAGNKEFESIAATANVMGLAVESTVDAYKALRAARFGSQEASDMIKLGADLQTVVGVNDDAVQRYFLALSQMKAKGKTSAEELMQIQEGVGLSQGAIFEALADQLGKPVSEIAKLQEQGKISADAGIAAIKTATLQMVHANKAGEATTREVSTTLRGMVRLLKSGADTWFITIGERLMPAFDGLAKRVMKTFQDFDKSGKFGAFTDAVVTVFERFVSAVEDAWPRIEKLFGDGVDGATDSLLELSRSFDDLIDNVLTVAEFIRDHWTAIKYTFVTVSGIVAAAIAAIAANSVLTSVKNLTGLVSGLAKAYKGAAAAQAAMAAAEGISGAAGAAEGAAGVAGAAGGAAKGGGLLAKVGGAFKSVGSVIASAGKVVAGAIGGVLATAGSAIVGAAQGLLSAIGTALAGISLTLVAAVVAAVAGVGAAIWQGIQLWQEWDTDVLVRQLKADWASLTDWFGGLFQSIADIFTGFNATAWEIGAGIVNAMTGGLASAAASLAEQAWQLGQQAIQAVKDAIGWASPPKAFIELGRGSATAFLDSLTSTLPGSIQLDLGANVAANDVQAAATEVKSAAPTAPEQQGWLDRAMAGIAGLFGGQDQTAPAVSAAGAEMASSGPAPAMGPESWQAITEALSGLAGPLAAIADSLAIGPANDVLPATSPVALPMAVGSDLGPQPIPTAPALLAPQASAGLAVERGASYGGPGGTQQVWQISIAVTVEGNASEQDAAALAESIGAQIMPKVRSEIQRTLTNAGGSAT